jgi:hypothetical protein
VLILPALLIFMILLATARDRDNIRRFAIRFSLVAGLFAGAMIGLVLGEHGIK